MKEFYSWNRVINKRRFISADIILALGWKGLGAVRALQCDHVIRETSDNPSGELKTNL